jgi:hypothetical protein
MSFSDSLEQGCEAAGSPRRVITSPTIYAPLVRESFLGRFRLRLQPQMGGRGLVRQQRGCVKRSPGLLTATSQRVQLAQILSDDTVQDSIENSIQYTNGGGGAGWSVGKCGVAYPHL